MFFPLSMRKSDVVLFSFMSLMLIEVCWLCLWGVVVPNLACGSAVAGVGLLCWRRCFYSAVWTLETSCLTTWALTNPSDRHPLIDCSGITWRRSVWLRIMQRDSKADYKIDRTWWNSCDVKPLVDYDFNADLMLKRVFFQKRREGEFQTFLHIVCLIHIFVLYVFRNTLHIIQWKW